MTLNLEDWDFLLPVSILVLSATGSPSPPLLHEVKLSGPGSRGQEVVWLRQESKLTLRHEVKLSGHAAGGKLSSAPSGG